MPRLTLIAVLAALPLALVACGGSSGSAAAAPQGAASGPGTSQIAGISTPSGVAVVTAKNAQ